MSFEPVIGLEIHYSAPDREQTVLRMQYAVRCAAECNTCPVCLGLPGRAARAEPAAVELAIKAALALGCTVIDLHLRAEELLLS
jgi:aspartyl-tRNA(Asn)/glutamyl-tRNA(Gln) amidotransferase subunit B